MDNPTVKLRSHIKEINDIMLLAQSSFKIVDYLLRGREVFEAEVINQNRFLKYSTEVHWRIYVTEMSKLFAERDSDWFNLRRFIQKFKKGCEYNGITEITAQSVQNWEERLISARNKIDNLLLQRDKLYSHTDKNRGHVKNELSFLDAKELIQIIQNVISEIYLVVMGSTILFDPVGEPVDDLKKIITIMVEEKKDLDKFFRIECKAHGINPKDIGP